MKPYPLKFNRYKIELIGIICEIYSLQIRITTNTSSDVLTKLWWRLQLQFRRQQLQSKMSLEFKC